MFFKRFLALKLCYKRTVYSVLNAFCYNYLSFLKNIVIYDITRMTTFIKLAVSRIYIHMCFISFLA